MTGFARVRKALAEGELVLSLKSVNHRALDLHFHLPSDLDQYEPALRTVLKAHINRGHIQIQVQISGGAAASGGFNRELLREWLVAFRAAAAEFDLDSKPDLNVAFRLPGIMQSCGLPEVNLEPVVIEAVTEAVHLLNAFRDH